MEPAALAAAHRTFAAQCFNEAWDLLDKPDRTPADDERMLARAYASVYHWEHRPDATPTTQSVGWWQLSRVHAVIGRADGARHYGELALAAAADTDPFTEGYAHEALARAARLTGDHEAASRHLAAATACLARVTDTESQALLRADLESIGGD